MKLLQLFQLTLVLAVGIGLMSRSAAQDPTGKQEDQTPKKAEQDPSKDDSSTKQDDAAKSNGAAPKQDDAKQDDAKKQESGTTGQTTETYVDLMTDWKEHEAKLKALEAEFIAARVLRRDEIRSEYTAILDKVNELIPQLRRTAIAAYEEKPNEDESLVRLLIGMLTNDLQKKRYDAFFKLGDVLIKGKCDIKHLRALNDSKRLVQPINTTQFGQFRYSDYINELIARHSDYLKGDLPRVVIKTSYGDIEIELFEDVTPNHVANYISLTEKDYYNGSKFHRVESSVQGQGLNLAQGGIPADGKKIDYTLEAEWDKPGRRKHFKGHVGAARIGGQNNSASSEFYILTGDAPSLDMPLNSYTVFGRVVAGLEFARQLKEGDEMLSVEVIRKRDHEYKPVPYSPENSNGSGDSKAAAKNKASGGDSKGDPSKAAAPDSGKDGKSAPPKDDAGKSDKKEDKK